MKRGHQSVPQPVQASTPRIDTPGTADEVGSCMSSPRGQQLSATPEADALLCDKEGYLATALDHYY